MTRTGLVERDGPWVVFSSLNEREEELSSIRMFSLEPLLNRIHKLLYRHASAGRPELEEVRRTGRARRSGTGEGLDTKR